PLGASGSARGAETATARSPVRNSRQANNLRSSYREQRLRRAPPWSSHELFDRITHHQRVRSRLRHRRRGGHTATRPQRRRGPKDFGEEKRAGLDGRVAAQGVSALAHYARAALAEREVSDDRLSKNQLLLGAEVGEAASIAGRGGSGAAAHVRAPWHSA